MVKTAAFGCILLTGIFLTIADAFAAEEKTVEEKNRIELMDHNREEYFGGGKPKGLALTDPEYAAIRDRLVLGEILDNGSLGIQRQELLTIVALTAMQTLDSLEIHVQAALNADVGPVEIKECVYQIAPYVGVARVDAALRIINSVLEKNGISLPLENQGTVSEESRYKDGLALQNQLFGAGHIKKMQDNAPAGQREIVRNFLSAYCFGEFYTRKGMDLKMRVLVVFSAIVSLGGCDPQARAHAKANIVAGNTKQNLVDALATLLPYIGFPRTLNGLAAVNEAVPDK